MTAAPPTSAAPSPQPGASRLLARMLLLLLTAEPSPAALPLQPGASRLLARTLPLLPTADLDALADLAPDLRSSAAWQAAAVGKLYRSSQRDGSSRDWTRRDKEAVVQGAEAWVHDLKVNKRVPQGRVSWLELRIVQARMRLEQEASGACSPATLAAWRRLRGAFAESLDTVYRARGETRAEQQRRKDRGEGRFGLGFDAREAGLIQSMLPNLLEGDLDTGPLLPKVTAEDLNGGPWKQALLSTLWARDDAEQLFAPGGELHGLLPLALEQAALSEAQLLAGRGDPAHFGAVFERCGGNLLQLQERVELELTSDNPPHFALDEPLLLHVATKGVQSVTVKVYELQTWRYHTLTGSELDIDCQLDGLGASHELVIDLQGAGAAPVLPVRKVKRTIELPQLGVGRRGVWVVEVVGGALQSRALLRRGNVRFVERVGPAGQALTLLYEDDTPLQGAKVWLDGTEYQADEDSGEVLLPFRDGARRCALVMGDAAGFAAMHAGFQHLSEQYTLGAGFHLDPESAVARSKAPLLVHAHLLLHGWAVPLSLLSDVTLTVTTTDSSSESSTQTVHGFSLSEAGNQAAVHLVRVPERCTSIDVNLTARVRLMLPGHDGGPNYQSLSARQSFPLCPRPGSNKDSLPALSDAHLTMKEDGSYALAVLGRAGEVRPGATVHLRLAHRLCEAHLHVEQQLASDEQGLVHLGKLDGISWLSASLPPSAAAQDPFAAMPCTAWTLSCNGGASPAPHPGVRLQAVAGPAMRVHVPLPWSDSGIARNVKLFEFDWTGAGLRRDLSADHLSYDVAGYVTVHGVNEDGWYALLGLPGAVGPITLRVLRPPASASAAPTVVPTTSAGAAPAQRSSGVVVSGGREWALAGDGIGELSEAKPLQVTSFEVSAAGGVSAQLAGSARVLRATTVHVILSRFYPCIPSQGRAEPALQQLALPVIDGLAGGPIWVARPLQPPPSVQLSNRRISDEVRYVLERRQHVKAGRVRPGVLLERPSLLAQPWRCSDTVTDKAAPLHPGDSPRAAAGDPYMRSNRAMLMSTMCAPSAAYGKMIGGRGMASNEPEPQALGFCPASAVLPNVTFDLSTGKLHLSPAQLAALGVDLPTSGHRVATLMAVCSAAGAGAASAVQTTVPVVVGDGGVVAAAEPPLVRAMLERPFPGGTACVEARSSQALLPGQSFVAPDASSAKIKVYGALPGVWTLLGALLNDAPGLANRAKHSANWSTFEFVGRWGALGTEQKQAHYAEHGCRELDFFLLLKDRTLFASLVAPLLSSKLASSRCFLDEFMLAVHQEDGGVLSGARVQGVVAKWGKPERYRTLNVLERILLAAAAPEGPAAAAALRLLALDLRAQLRVSSSREADMRRFQVALTSGEGSDDSMLARAAVDGGGGGPGRGGMVPPMPPPPMGGMAFGGSPGARAPDGGMMRRRGSSSDGSVSSDDDGSDAEADENESMDLLGMDLSNSADMKKRQALAAAPAFVTARSTKEWAESGWYRTLGTQVSPDDIVPPSLFWADYADHLAAAAEASHALTLASLPTFVPQRLHAAATTFSDALMSLAVLGLPWQDVPPVPRTDGGTRLTLTAAEAGPCVVYACMTQPAAVQGGAGGTAAGTAAPEVVLLQRIVDPFDVERRPRAVGDGGDDGDDDEIVGNEEGGREVSGPLLAHKVYRLQVTVTSSTRRRQLLDATLQAPRGSVVLCGRPAVWTSRVELYAFGTSQLELTFYYPAPGTYDQFPATAARKGRLVGLATGVAQTLQVLATRPPTEEPAGSLSWRQLCEAVPSPATDAALLEYLAQAKDLAVQDLALVRWRLRDAAFFRAVCAALRGRMMWPAAVWEYALLHGSETELRELLVCWRPLLDRLGPCASTPLLVKDAALQGGFGHREYFPLVNPRVHELTGRKVVLNRDLQNHWTELLKVLAHKAAPSAQDLVQAACFLVAMDRFDEAEELLPRILAAGADSPDAAAAPAFVEYLRTWLLLASPLSAPTGPAELTAAAERALAAAAAAGAESRWKRRWEEMAACCAEAAAGGPGEGGPQGDGAAAVRQRVAPSLALLEEGGVLVVDVMHVKKLALSVYLMDLELLFSAQPFGTAGGGGNAAAGAGPGGLGSGGADGAPSNFAFVSPSHSTTLDLEALLGGGGSTAGVTVRRPPAGQAAAPCEGCTKLAIDVGLLFPGLQGTSSVMVEVSGGGITARRPQFRSQLSVQAFQQLGLLQVSHAATGAAVPAAYVKVYSRPPGAGAGAGAAVFHKDGYTDRRGKFDYFSLTTGDTNAKVGPLAMLVSHAELGSTVLQCSPPPH